MKKTDRKLAVALAAVLAGTSGATATSLPGVNVGGPLVSVSTTELPRITQTIDNDQRFILAKTQPSFTSRATSSTRVSDTITISHMQLVLKPSVARKAALETLIADQHNPNSPQFDHWLTPQQYGADFGVLDSDVVATTAWLRSQGFTVNTVYPNNTQIDFTGTVGQIRQAFQTNIVTLKVGEGTLRASSGDISIPMELKSVVAGVMGLNSSPQVRAGKKLQNVKWDASTQRFLLTGKTKGVGTSKVIGDAIPIGGGGGIPVDSGVRRALVPNDMATMYGIREIRANGVVGTGVTIALLEEGVMDPDNYNQFVSTFNLAKFGGTFRQFDPAPPSGPTNCYDESVLDPSDTLDYPATATDAEMATAIAPGANIEVATCSGYDPSGDATTNNSAGGIFIAAANLINATNSRPDVISVSPTSATDYLTEFGGSGADSASKTAIDMLWAQADAEGISVYVGTGDSGIDPSFTFFADGFVNDGSDGNGTTIVNPNALATSPHVTAVGGTDLADTLDGTTSKYFAPTPSVVGGSALSYVPEIPWNASCGNGIAAQAYGYNGAPAFCEALEKLDPGNTLLTSESSGAGASVIDAKPSWQKLVYNAANDQSRDIPDVSLFAGSWSNYTAVVICDDIEICSPGLANPVDITQGTNVAASMFAGIQALMDQGLHMRGLPLDQGNAAPTLYALAANEYGLPGNPMSAGLTACNADNGSSTDAAGCVFHNVTRGSMSSQCIQLAGMYTPNCWFYANNLNGEQVGLTTMDDSPTSYGPSNKAYGARPGWSFASGLGSVDAKNLLIAWRAFDHAPPATSH